MDAEAISLITSLAGDSVVVAVLIVMLSSERRFHAANVEYYRQLTRYLLDRQLTYPTPPPSPGEPPNS